MRKVYEYSHLGGSEILQVRYPDIDRDIDTVIAEISLPAKTKVSKEKTMMGKLLYSPTEMNEKFKVAFGARGFVELRSPYEHDIPGYPTKIKGSFKQVDFTKEDVLVEVQLGKYFAMFYDLAKFQYFFNESRCEVGVEIVPSYGLYREMSSGVSYGEQLVTDIRRLRRHFPAVPVKVILIDVPGMELPAEVTLSAELRDAHPKILARGISSVHLREGDHDDAC